MYTKLEALYDMKTEVQNEILALQDQLANDYLDDFDRGITQSNLEKNTFRLQIILGEIQALSE